MTRMCLQVVPAGHPGACNLHHHRSQAWGEPRNVAMGTFAGGERVVSKLRAWDEHCFIMRVLRAIETALSLYTARSCLTCA